MVGRRNATTTGSRDLSKGNTPIGDKTSGEECWRTDRDEMTSWSTPLVVEHGGHTQVVASATDRVRSYDADTGRLLWDGAGVKNNAIPSPVAADGRSSKPPRTSGPNLAGLSSLTASISSTLVVASSTVAFRNDGLSSDPSATHRRTWKSCRTGEGTER